MDCGLSSRKGRAQLDCSPVSPDTLRQRRRLLVIWSKRPAATDTAENIARKWLGHFDCSSVYEALRALLDEGLIQRYISGGQTFYFLKNYSEIRRQATGA